MADPVREGEVMQPPESVAEFERRRAVADPVREGEVMQPQQAVGLPLARCGGRPCA